MNLKQKYFKENNMTLWFSIGYLYISNGQKTAANANASFSVQSKIFPKLKAQILQMRFKNVQEGSSFTVERKIYEIFILSSCFQ